MVSSPETAASATHHRLLKSPTSAAKGDRVIAYVKDRLYAGTIIKITNTNAGNSYAVKFDHSTPERAYISNFTLKDLFGMLPLKSAPDGVALWTYRDTGEVKQEDLLLAYLPRPSGGHYSPVLAVEVSPTSPDRVKVEFIETCMTATISRSEIILMVAGYPCEMQMAKGGYAVYPSNNAAEMGALRLMLQARTLPQVILSRHVPPPPAVRKKNGTPSRKPQPIDGIWTNPYKGSRVLDQARNYNGASAVPAVRHTTGKVGPGVLDAKVDGKALSKWTPCPNDPLEDGLMEGAEVFLAKDVDEIEWRQVPGRANYIKFIFRGAAHRVEEFAIPDTPSLRLAAVDWIRAMKGKLRK